MVREVGVHRDVDVEVVFDGVVHARENGRAEAEFAGAMQDVDARVGLGKFVGEGAGAVGELSSVTRMSTWGAKWWISSIKGRRLPRSL